jgi:hypothetical protein
LGLRFARQKVKIAANAAATKTEWDHVRCSSKASTGPKNGMVKTSMSGNAPIAAPQNTSLVATPLPLTTAKVVAPKTAWVIKSMTQE